MSAETSRELLTRYCLTCHNDLLAERGTVPATFEHLDLTNVRADAEVWERVIRKLRLGMMPPAGQPRPERATYDRFVTWLETALDQGTSFDPGRPAVRRLTEAEYINAVDSLLAVEADQRWLLFPADDVDEQGFATS